MTYREAWEDEYEAELARAVDELKAAGRMPFVGVAEGEDDDGAPTHWYAEDPDTGEVLSPSFKIDDYTWEREKPQYFNLGDLEEQIQDRAVERWGRDPV
jgi:hypothetical protein